MAPWRWVCMLRKIKFCSVSWLAFQSLQSLLARAMVEFSTNLCTFFSGFCVSRLRSFEILYEPVIYRAPKLLHEGTGRGAENLFFDRRRASFELEFQRLWFRVPNEHESKQNEITCRHQPKKLWIKFFRLFLVFYSFYCFILFKFLVARRQKSIR